MSWSPSAITTHALEAAWQAGLWCGVLVSTVFWSAINFVVLAIVGSRQRTP